MAEIRPNIPPGASVVVYKSNPVALKIDQAGVESVILTSPGDVEKYEGQPGDTIEEVSMISTHVILDGVTYYVRQTAAFYPRTPVTLTGPTSDGVIEVSGRGWDGPAIGRYVQA